jgi:deoxyribodipyrimidine photo-lyase
MPSALVWFRRDLRDCDHAALYHALKHYSKVYCVFVFDTAILDTLPSKEDRRVEFIWESVNTLKTALQKNQSDLVVLHGSAVQEIPMLAKTLNVEAVFSNRDYEPLAIQRDAQVAAMLANSNILFYQFKDHVIFEEDEVLTQLGKPYTVFTPYKNACYKKLTDFFLTPYPVDKYIGSLVKCQPTPMPTLESLGFKVTNLSQLKLPTGMQGAQQLFNDFMFRIGDYHETRNFPAVKGPSYLSVHLRFGTISIRQLARAAKYASGEGAVTWLNELMWRDFYFQVLYHRPDLQEGHAFKQEYEHLNYPNNPLLFEAWCNGETGYPIVDAGMRQLNQTGYMHNRLRMVTASFLVKDLLIDWRWGEQYFADKLIDFDFSANNGGWQWAASTGCDAQPYFRIFNPLSQSQKFDAKGQFIRKYIPEIGHLSNELIHDPYGALKEKKGQLIKLEHLHYPQPVVEHAEQRDKALALYKKS